MILSAAESSVWKDALLSRLSTVTAARTVFYFSA